MLPRVREFYQLEKLWSVELEEGGDTPEPASGLPVRALAPDDGWCDDPAHGDYNRPVKLPFAASHEVLWRDDHLYDVIVVVGHNDEPPRAGLGSAIFIHCATADYAPTEGCIALDRYRA